MYITTNYTLNSIIYVIYTTEFRLIALLCTRVESYSNCCVFSIVHLPSRRGGACLARLWLNTDMHDREICKDAPRF